MKTIRHLLVAALAACLFTSPLPAQVPQIINYQGRVAVGTVNFEGTGQFKFALVNGTGTTTFWSNDGTSVGGSEPTAAVSLTVTKGLYSVLLGNATLPNMTVVPATIFNNADVRLRVWFNDGTNGSQLLTPDQRIAAVGYAMMAGNVQDGAITSAKIAAGAVGSAQLAPGATSAPVIVSGTTQGLVANTRYALTEASPTELSLPSGANIGDMMEIVAAGTGGWTVGLLARESNRSWRTVASSVDGTKLVAAVFGGQIYTSTDSGVSWAPRETSRQWASVASSADGTKLVAAVLNGQIYTSTDSGVNWTPRESDRQWDPVASSADGTKLVAAVLGGQIYTSTDSGVSWTPRETSRQWASVASSADGTKLVAAARNGQIYTSTNAGVGWTPRAGSLQWNDVASSADGTKLVAAVQGGLIYTSTDSGNVWLPRGSNRNWRTVASSADGAKLVAGVFGGQIYTSTDSGVSWTPQGSNRNWISVASSANGTRLAAAVFGGQLYTSMSYELSGSADTATTLRYAASGEWVPVLQNRIAGGAIGNAEIATAANIDAAKIGTGVVSTTEFNRLSGVTSNIQTQLNAKLNLSGGTLTGGLTAPSFTYSAAQTRYLAVPAAAFRPVDDTIVYSSAGTGVILRALGTGTAVFTAPVLLPHGAVITGAKLVALDNDTTLNLTLTLRSALDTLSGSTILATMVTTGNSATAQEIASGVLSKTVANDSERIFLTAGWDASAGNSIDLRQVTITYTVTQPAP